LLQDLRDQEVATALSSYLDYVVQRNL
jgi:hypothetical protein